MPTFRDCSCDPAVRQIISRGLADFSLNQVFVEPLRSLSMQFEQTLAQFALPMFITGGASAIFLDHGYPGASGEFAHR